MRFPETVQREQERLVTQFTEGGADDELIEALSRPQYPQDAEGVNDCVQRLARAELGGIAVGRSGPITVFPPIGDFLGKQIRGAGDSGRSAAVEAINTSLAVGYVVVASCEDPVASPVEGRHPREIWNVWAPGLSAGLIDAIGLSPDVIRMIRDISEGRFSEEMKTADLVPFRRRLTVRKAGSYFGQGGATLRAVQVHPEELQPNLMNQWGYDEYPPEPE